MENIDASIPVYHINVTQIRGAFNNLSTWVRKKQLITKKYFFIFQCSPLVAQYTSPTFVATTLTPWKKIFLLLFKPGRDCILDFFIAWKSTAWTPFWKQDFCDIPKSRILSQNVEKNVPDPQWTAPSSLDSTGDECPSEKDSAFLGPILHW
jgi:hypothetical protein